MCFPKNIIACMKYCQVCSSKTACSTCNSGSYMFENYACTSNCPTTDGYFINGVYCKCIYIYIFFFELHYLVILFYFIFNF